MQNIVVLTDFSFISFNPLELAKKIPDKVDGTIHLVHVIEPTSRQYSSMGDVIEDSLSSAYNTKLLEKVKADLIAMSVREKSGVRRLISGESLAEEVNDHTVRPALTCRLETENI